MNRNHSGNVAAKRRLPLTVEAIFKKDGKLIPTRLYWDGEPFEIERILGIQPFCPPGIACIAPIRYTVRVRGREKELYYEKFSGSWFSVKEV